MGLRPHANPKSNRRGVFQQPLKPHANPKANSVTSVGDDGAGGGVEGADGGLEEADAGFDQVAVEMADLGGGLAAEHDFQFGEAEDEGVALVDEDDVDGAAEGFGEDSGEFEAARAGAEDYYAGSHGGGYHLGNCALDFAGYFREIVAGRAKCGGSSLRSE